MRTIPRVARCLLPICLLVLSTACGQKGPLYLPDNAPAPGSAAEMPCRTQTCKAMQQKAEAVKAAQEAESAGTTPASAPATTESPASSTSATTLELQPQAPSQQAPAQQAPSEETNQ